MLFQSVIGNLLHHLYRSKNQIKHHSSSTSNTAAIVDNVKLSNLDSFNSIQKSLIQQLDSISPRFELNNNEIEILNNPLDFYDLLKLKIKNAEYRIFLSSLYIGKGQDDLIECLSNSLSLKPNLKLDILIDCLRSTRDVPNKSTISLLLPLIQKFGIDRVNIRFYHTPNLKGLTKYFLPKRINEGWGLQHMKIYGFDNHILLSGANLSQDYFTNRQDRYYLFKNHALSDYYYNLQSTISKLSYKLIINENSKNGFDLIWPSTNPTNEPYLNLNQFINDSTLLLTPLLKKHPDSYKPLDNSKTLIYPVSSFKPIMNPDLSTEKSSILRLLQLLSNNEIEFYFTSGYFNMTLEYKLKLINSKAKGKVITAAPHANSFYRSKGISKHLPTAYLNNSRIFINDLNKVQNSHNVELLEWSNGIVNTVDGWSYHAKGIWFKLPNEKQPSITIVGSSNYTNRSYNLDLESNVILLTIDDDLKLKMQFEVDNLLKNCKKLGLDDFNGDRSIHFGVKIATRLLNGML
ncbi:hypothetical protein CANARDRAFT_219986 [[Candida] arabinofermentans NRRL YB-2248]|uniref:CDP-diacylglycerol--glycerol-3-phosphate 3-phosphatidyltransferase n=1 Tax=[Candida] arabinofermentans NRRL YB-2248 TaxID=983967 RepID=A0A1E4T1Q1_9ASCO|nr:hypothetical protein CANARDRAFT_219986 [[Candida] arabinofermentans NRRL YB-2248]